jgi:hypothetical protein
VWVVHQRQRLLLGFKTGNNLLGIHTRLDDLQGNLPPDGLMLLGKVDDAHTALPQNLQQLIAPNLSTGCFSELFQKNGSFIFHIVVQGPGEQLVYLFWI